MVIRDSAVNGRQVRRPRVGVVSLYFPFFDAQMPSGFRESRRQVARGYAGLLEEMFDVVDAGMLCDEADGDRARQLLGNSDLDAIVVAPAMAAPPSPVMRALENIDLPLLIWNAPVIDELPAAMRQKDATINSTAVACVMLANTLLRQGRPFTTVTANPTDPVAVEELRRSVQAIAAASVVRGASALRVGGSMAGYYDVEASAAQLDELGVAEVSISLQELNSAFHDVDEDAAEARLHDLLDRGWRHTPGKADVRSARLALTLEGLMRRHDASFGTVNCHGPFFRENTEIGITACLGVSLLTADERPLSCTGDQPAALALRLAKALTGRSLYCEFYTPELSTGLMLLAAGGEGDYTWADPDAPPHLEPNYHYPGSAGFGASVSFALRPGAATVMSLSPLESGWRLAWATGEIVESRYPAMGGPNAMFRFDSGHCREIGTSWIESGASHHHALAAGRLDLEIPLLAKTLGIEAVRI